MQKERVGWPEFTDTNTTNVYRRPKILQWSETLAKSLKVAREINALPLQSNSKCQFHGFSRINVRGSPDSVGHRSLLTTSVDEVLFLGRNGKTLSNYNVG